MNKDAFEFAYFEGEIIPLKEANINIRTHALQYGTACFEGIRAYELGGGEFAVIKCEEHYQRMQKSARILGMKFPLTAKKATEKTFELLRKNKPNTGVYIRPILYKSAYEIGPRFTGIPEEMAIYMIPLGDYLDVKKGIRATISSWRRISDNALPTRAKVTGAYVNSALAKTEALLNGYDEAIFLNENGKVAEGSAENIFIVKDGVLITPPETANILEGITRNCVLEIARDEGIPTLARDIARTELYAADEVFLCGTGAQIAWIREIDGRQIGTGQIGKVSSKVQEIYFDAVHGRSKKYQSWIDTIEV